MWSDINNGDNTTGIKDKLNDIADYLVNSAIMAKVNYQVPISAWVQDSTYTDFTYRADIPFEGCSEDLIPYVHYGIEQASSGEYMGVKSDTNKISIWSKVRNSFVIPYILLFGERGSV